MCCCNGSGEKKVVHVHHNSKAEKDCTGSAIGGGFVGSLIGAAVGGPVGAVIGGVLGAIGGNGSCQVDKKKA